MNWLIGDAAPSAAQLDEIAHALLGGDVVLMPTDTIYGLHAVATNDDAVARIAELKGRDETKPFLVLAPSIDALTPLGISADRDLLNRLGSVWPAPLTAILPLVRPIAASRGASTLGVRIPDLLWLRSLLERTGPLASTSANRSGEPVVDRPSALSDDLRSRVSIVDGGVRTGEASAILDLTGIEPNLIREGDPLFTQKLRKSLWKKP
jgi:L-threonylcarbamoyladenylate synthase